MSRTCAGLGPRTASEMSDETTHPDPREEASMLLYDDTAAEALHAAADEVRRLGATKYETAHVLLGLLRTADPVTGPVIADHAQLTEHSVRSSLAARSGYPREYGAPQAPGRRSPPEPAAE